MNNGPGSSTTLLHPVFINRAVAKALIGGEGVYSYIRVMPDGFLLKSVVFKFGLVQTSNFSCAELNVNDLSSLLELICIRFGT